jgi:uncharacterized protein
VNGGGLLESARRQASTLEEVGHRPWPAPERPWVVGQTWDDLLFVHYRVPVEELRKHVPGGLEVDEHSGSGWLGVTPFVVTGLRARGLPPVPYVSDFFELNVRTYVTRNDRPGIWFFSLDTSSRLAVEAARRFYRLPYFHAHISLSRAEDRLTYDCSRHEGKAFSGTYGPAGAVFEAESGSLEHFFAQRYCFYGEHEGKIYRAEIHHRPWRLQPAEARIDLDTMPPGDLRRGDDEPVFHYSERQDVVIWPLGDA